MGLWDRIKDVGGRAGNWIGNEVGRVVAPIGSAIEGDYRGALSGIGRNIKRAGQAGALLGKDRLAGVDVDLLGAGGGAIEGALGPSEYAQGGTFGKPDEPGGGGFAGTLSGAAKGYGGVQAGKGLHNIGERLGVNKQLTKINPFGKGHILGPTDYGPTRDEILQGFMTTPSVVERLEGETDEAFAGRFADAEYYRGSRLKNSGPVRFDDYSTTAEAIGPQKPGHAPGIGEGGMRSTATGTGRSSRVDTPMQAEGRRILDATADADPRTIRTRTAGTPLVPEGKIRHRFAAMGGPGGERYPEQQAAIEQAQWRATVPDQPDPIRTPGFYSPDTPVSERTPLSFPTPQIPEDVIDPRSYMNAPGAVPTPSSIPSPGYTALSGPMPAGAEAYDRAAQPSSPGRNLPDPVSVGLPGSIPENMDARGAVPAARFGAPGASGAPPEMVGGPVYSNPLTGGYSPMPGASSVGTMVNKAAESVTPTETTTDGDPRSIWRRGLDYAGENINADTVINAAGQWAAGGGANDYYRRQAAVAERRMTLQEQQQAYAQDKERLREAMMMRGSTSRWA